MSFDRMTTKVMLGEYEQDVERRIAYCKMKIRSFRLKKVER